MKLTRFFAVFAVSAFITSVAHAGFGLGIILGEPTGLSGQYVLNSKQKINMTLAYSFNSWVQMSGDYIMVHPQFVANLLKRPSPVAGYLGIGAVLGISTDNKNSNSDLNLGARIPFGLEWRPEGAPFALFGELVPGLQLVSSTELLFQGGIGGRYYF